MALAADRERVKAKVVLPLLPSGSDRLLIEIVGAAVVKAIDDVLAKSPPAVVRVNAIRLLEVVAESGAPAATDRITKLLDPKTPAVDTLYWGLKAAEKDPWR